MRFYKLRVTPNATKIASTFNEQFQPEKIAEHNDYQTEWIDGTCTEEVLVGEKVLEIFGSLTLIDEFSVGSPHCRPRGIRV